MKLTNSDVQEILRLLDDTSYDELHLQTENFNLSLKRSGTGWIQSTQTTSGANVSQLQGTEEEKADRGDKGTADVERENKREGLEEIRAPMVGTFYKSPKPGAEPFVRTGTRVEENTVIAIIEVMKLMNSIAAGVKGEVVEILVDDAQYVEKGQLLMRVRP